MSSDWVLPGGDTGLGQEGREKTALPLDVIKLALCCCMTNTPNLICFKHQTLIVPQFLKVRNLKGHGTDLSEAAHHGC